MAPQDRECSDAGTVADPLIRGFNSLPLEIRNLIWEATLPPCRLFRVSDIGRFSHNPTPGAALGAVPIFTLHIYHSPPVATQVCRESRLVALRRGFFLRSQQDPSPNQNLGPNPSLSPDPDRGRAAVDPGVWFNPDRDILYFDCNLRYFLRTRDGKPWYEVPGWDRVLHVGVEWRAFLRDVPRFTEDQDMGPSWRAAFALLYMYMPHLRTVNYIIPVAGRTCVRSGSRLRTHADTVLMPLPDDAHIPWEARLNPGGLSGPAPVVPHAHTMATYTTTWAEVRKNMYQAFERADGDAPEQVRGADIERLVQEPPLIKGWWLGRAHAVLDMSMRYGDW